MIIAQTPAAFKRAIPTVLAQCEGDMTPTFQAILIELLEQMRILEERIARTNQWIASFMKNSVLCQKIQAIDGVGPIADGDQKLCAHHFSAILCTAAAISTM